MSRIFLSHSSANNAQALALRDWLSANGWGRDDIFLDIDPQSGIAPGERWQRSLNDAASRCEAVVFLISRDWLASRWCHEELALAHKLNKRLFGVLIGAVKTAEVPARLSGEWQLIDLESGRDGIRIDVEMPDGTQGFSTFSRSGLQRFKAGLQKAGLDPRFFAWPPTAEPGRAPYRGLAPMEAEDAGIFYGREAATIAALDQLRGLAEAAPPRLMAVLGASGAGKSSFMRAGLIPRLKRDDRNFLVLPVLRPERAAISGPSGLAVSLAGAAQALGLKAWTKGRAAIAIKAGHNDVAALLNELATAAANQIGAAAGTRPPSIVLPIDQAEELFHADGRDEAQVVLTLLEPLLLHRTLGLIALVTIRTDSYQMLQLAPQLSAIKQTPFSLPALARGAYQRVIEGPAERLAGTERALRIEPALSEALLRDIDDGGGKDALPLLAFTLERLFIEHGSDGDLTLAEYRDSGGISGAIEAAVERALAAADADPGVPRDRQAKLALLRRGMIPWLASIDPETKTARRQVARFSDIPDEARPLIERFVDQHLLSTDVTGGERTIEPAHEALLRQWGQIDAWLKHDIAVLATLEGIRRAARDWHMNRNDPIWLVHAGGRLEDAEAVKSRADLVRRLDQTDLAYLDACRAAEAARRDKELEEARKLAEARSLAARRTRIGAVAASLLAVAAAGFGWYGLRQAVFANEQAEIAQAESTRAAANAIEAERQKAEADAQRAEAERQAEIAREQEELAREQLTRAQVNSSRFLASAARDMLREDGDLALSLAVAALPHDLDQPDRPMVAEAGDALFSIMAADPLRAILNYGHTFDNARFSPDSRRVMTESYNGVRIWDAGSGALVAFAEVDGTINKIVYSADSRFFAAVPYSEKPAQIFDAVSGAKVATLGSETAIDAAFSADGSTIVTALYDETVRTWETATGKLLSTATMGSSMLELAVSPDATRFVAATTEGDPRLWDTRSGLPIATLPVEGLDKASFSRNGARLVTRSYAGVVSVWDASTGALLLTVHENSGATDSLLSPDGAALLTVVDNVLELWDTATGERAGLMNGDGHIQQVTVSRDGKLVLTRSDRATKVWQATDGKLVWSKKSSDDLLLAGLSSDNGYALLATKQGVSLWNIAADVQQGWISHDGNVIAASFSPDASQILTLSEQEGRLWRVPRTDTGTTLQLQSDVAAMQFAPSDDSLLTRDDNGVSVWRTPGGEAVLTLPGEYSDAAYTADGREIVTASTEGVHIRDVATGSQVGTLQADRSGTTIAVDPDGKRFATLESGNVAYLWDAPTRKLLARLAHDETFEALVEMPDWNSWNSYIVTPQQLNVDVVSVNFSPDGTRVITTANDSTARVWDAATGELLHSLLIDQIVWDGAISADNTRAATFSSMGSYTDGGVLKGESNDHVAQIWNLETGKRLAEVAHDARVLKVLISPDSKVLATIAADNNVYVWNLATGTAIGVLAHHDPVAAMAFVPGESRLVTVSEDGARLWNATTATLIRRLGDTDRPAYAVAIDPDGSNLAVAYGLTVSIAPLPAPLSVLLATAQASQAKLPTTAEETAFGIDPPSWLAALDERRAAMNECDRLAGHPYDDRLGPGGVFRISDSAAAVAACQDAVDANSGEARFLYQLGRALEDQFQWDTARASYEAAGNAGYAIAYTALGDMAGRGYGMTADLTVAQAYYEKAAEAGEPIGSTTLGKVLWNSGDPGDRDRAETLWARAAESGYPLAQERLAWVAELGRDGNPADLTEAFYRYAVAVQLAEEHGDLEAAATARYRRATLARSLPPDVVAAEWRRAESFTYTRPGDKG